MWWERWIPKSYLIKSSVCSVEYIIDENDASVYVAFLQRKKNKLEISDKSRFNTIADAGSLIAKHKASLVITVNGKGVILKKIIFSENDSLELNDLVRQHLPTININEFYIQFYKNTNNTGYLAICRKVLLDEILTHVASLKAELVNVFIGSLVCNSLAVLTAAHNRIYSSTYQLNLVNGEVEEIIPFDGLKEADLAIDGINVSPAYSVSFAAGFSYLTQQANYSSDNKELTKLLGNHLESNKIRYLVSLLVIIIFVISGVNSVVFFQKFEENTRLDVELNLYESKNSQITQLLENYQKKKNLIEQTGIFENKKLSVYADKLAASLPGDIVLRELYFNPENDDVEEDSLVSFQNDELIIKGNCNKSLLLNEWVNVLKSQNFVKSINLESFIYNSEGHLPNFILKLETK